MPTEDDEDLDLYDDLISEQLTDQLINDQQITCILVSDNCEIWIFKKNNTVFFSLAYFVVIIR